MNLNVHVDGIERVQAKLGRAEASHWMRGVMDAATLDLKDYIAKYPKSTIANDPRARTWYERGYGPKWRRRDGSIGGSKTSETLGRRWTTRVEDSGRRGIVGNNASYAPFVQAEEQQASFHKARGWRTDAETLRERRDHILALFRNAIDKILRG